MKNQMNSSIRDHSFYLRIKINEPPKILLILLFILMGSLSGFSQGSVTYNSDATFTVPAGVTSVDVTVVGGGGGGGSNDLGSDGSGGGGGGGSATSVGYTVTPGSNITVVVGDGGSAGSGGNDGGNGGTSSFDGAISASGGSGGGGKNGGTVAGSGGSGGTGTAGSMLFNGGAGGNGAEGNAGRGGGGGSSAGDTAGGTNGTNGTSGGGGAVGVGGSAPTGGGDGGNGGGVNNAGLAATPPGGGGGGSGDNNGGQATLGGAGGAGTVVVSWTCPSAAISYTPSTFCGSAESALATLIGTTGGTYSSVPVAGISINSTTGELDLNGSTPGTYVIHYQIPASPGCAAVDATYSITVNEVPVINSITSDATDNTICEEEDIQLTVSATGTGLTYQWDDPNNLTDPDPTVTPVQSRVYTVIVTNSVGCSVTESIAVLMKQEPDPATTIDNTVCIGATTGLLEAECTDQMPVVGGTFTSGLQNFTYTSNVANTLDVSISGLPTSIPASAPDMIISIYAEADLDFPIDEQLTITGELGTFLGLTNNGIGSALCVESNTNVVLTATQYNAWAGDGVITITLVPPVVDNFINEYACDNNASATLVLPASAGPCDIEWYTSLTGGSSIFSGASLDVFALTGANEIDETVAGTHTYYAECVCDGCPSSPRTAATLTVEYGVTGSIDNGTSNDLCTAESLDLTAVVGTGTAGFTYAWTITNPTTTGASLSSATAETTTLSGTGAGTVDVSLVITDADDYVSATITESFTIEDSPTAAGGVSLEACNNGTGEGVFDLTDADAALIGAQTGVAVSYYGSAGDAANGTIGEIVGLHTSSPGSVFARVENTTNGCYAVAEVALIVNDLPELLAAASDVSCNGDTDGTATVTVLNSILGIFPTVDYTGDFAPANWFDADLIVDPSGWFPFGVTHNATTLEFTEDAAPTVAPFWRHQVVTIPVDGIVSLDWEITGVSGFDVPYSAIYRGGGFFKRN